MPEFYNQLEALRAIELALTDGAQTGGSISEANSTIAPLAAGATFVGEWESNTAPHIGFNVLSDQPGTLFLEFSTDDGATVTLSKPYACFADAPNFDALVKGARSHRIRYTNGGADQTQFSLLTFVGSDLYPYAKSDRDEPHYFGQRVSNVAATEHRILVDLSDNVLFPHYDVGSISLYGSYFQVDRDSNGKGSVLLGVITRIDATDADIAFVQGVIFDKSTDRRIVRDRDFPTPIKLSQSGGVLTRAVTNATALNVAGVNTATTLESPKGPVTPEVGDLIVQYEHAAGTYDASVAGFYAGTFRAS